VIGIKQKAQMYSFSLICYDSKLYLYYLIFWCSFSKLVSQNKLLIRSVDIVGSSQFVFHLVAFHFICENYNRPSHWESNLLQTKCTSNKMYINYLLELHSLSVWLSDSYKSDPLNPNKIQFVINLVLKNAIKYGECVPRKLFDIVCIRVTK